MPSTEPRDLFPGALEMMILQTLKRQPLHGYALAQHIKRASNDLLQVEEGSLYPALQRLLKAELVSAEWTLSAFTKSPQRARSTCSAKSPASSACLTASPACSPR